MASSAAALAFLMFTNSFLFKDLEQRHQQQQQQQQASLKTDDGSIPLLSPIELAIDFQNFVQQLRHSAELQNDGIEMSVDSINKDVNCVSGAYPPDASWKIPKRIVNLDLAPHERWLEIGLEYTDQMKVLLSEIHNLTHPFFHGLLFKLVDRYGPHLVETLPYPFADEMKGISDASGIALGEVALFNVFYEIFTLCTSILGQTESGQLFHGRNLDFGLLMGWDKKNNTWKTTEILRRMTVEVEFQRAGQTVFKSTTFAGYVGVFTALKPGLFSLTIDERFQVIGGYVGIIEWFMGKRNGNWMSFLTRSVLENCTTYEEAQNVLASSRLLSPVYFILGGNRSGQACVITRGLKFVDIWDISQAKWYLVQTNYDHWKKPPFFDDRRTPAKKCLDRLGQQNLTLSELFNVLSTKPVNNKETVYTVLMEVASGNMESYMQYCTDPDCPTF